MEISFYDEFEDSFQTLDEIMSLGIHDFSAAFNDSDITPDSVLDEGNNATTSILGDTLANHGMFEEISGGGLTPPNVVSQFNREVLLGGNFLYLPLSVPMTDQWSSLLMKASIPYLRSSTGLFYPSGCPHRDGYTFVLPDLGTS